MKFFGRVFRRRSQPRIIHVFWQSPAEILPTYREALRLYYSRIPQDTTEWPFIMGDRAESLLKTAESAGYDIAVVHREGVYYSHQSAVFDYFKRIVDKDSFDGKMLLTRESYRGGESLRSERHFLVDLREWRRRARPQLSTCTLEDRGLISTPDEDDTQDFRFEENTDELNRQLEMFLQFLPSSNSSQRRALTALFVESHDS